VHKRLSNKDTYFTECSGEPVANPANTFSDSLDWQTENLIIGATATGPVGGHVDAALNPLRPEHELHDLHRRPSRWTTTRGRELQREYYVLGQAQQVRQARAVRIGSNTFGSGNIEGRRLRNPDGSTALVVLNADTSNAHTFNVDENGQYFTLQPARQGRRRRSPGRLPLRAPVR